MNGADSKEMNNSSTSRFIEKVTLSSLSITHRLLLSLSKERYYNSLMTEARYNSECVFSFNNNFFVYFA